jgi:hypothetical protein
MDFTEVRPALWAGVASLWTGNQWQALEHTLMNRGFLKMGGEGDFRTASLSEFRKENV